ncbi:DNA polymerase/3'-5' exonuclease PolX [Candidatus Gottesmanbacteria bacterium]|nr:DNA polymerase/3'-5' exonuclease PolX [Candidatus Gottesmanbacteria bacterium]
MIGSVDNRSLAKLFRMVAAAYVLKNENRFKIIAYEKAADAIEHSTTEAKTLWHQGKLISVPGIGPTIASHLDELFKKGKVKHFENLLKDFPPAMFVLMDIPGFGPKKAYRLVTILGIKGDKDAVASLLKAAKEGKIRQIEGFGLKSEQDIIQRLREFKKIKGKSLRMVLPYAHQLAERILAYLKQNPYVLRAEPLGSLRRMVATIGDVDIAVVSKDAKSVLDWFSKYPGVERILERGPQTSSILVAGGKQIDLMVQPPESFGALLQHFTGSKTHNIHLREYALSKGVSLSEYGIKYQKSNKVKKFATEKDFYTALGLDWIPPELREDQGEIDAALHHSLPQIIDDGDIRGDLHIHTSYDLESSHDLGASGLKDLLKRADEIGYEYIGVSDHNPSITKHTSSQILNIIRERKQYYEHIFSSIKNTRVHLFIMLEIDILPNGELALPEGAFEYIDAGIASVHSSFNQSQEQTTKRVLRALSHPKIKILGHPSGRLLNKREGMQLSWDKIFDFCKNKKKALEINAYPDRLDLPDDIVRQAVAAGVKMVINTDSHHVDHMDLMDYGISVARRGWATKADILNTLSYNKFKDWLTGR